jgi:hypothetical protein
MKRGFKNLLLSSLAFFAFAGTVHAQNADDYAPRDYPKLDERITEESDFEYYYLLHDVFPNVKVDFLKPPENAATGSIRLRRLFGKSFSKLDERRRIVIKQTRWLRAKNKRKFLVVLFEAVLPAGEESSQKKAFFALAVFRYIKVREPEFSVMSPYKWKWNHVFELADAVDPRGDFEVELPRDIPTVKNARGDEIVWLLNSHASGDESFKNYNAVEFGGGRLHLFFKNFPGVYENSDCARRFEQKLEIVPQTILPKSTPYEIRVVSRIWMNNDCRALETFGDLREIETYRASRQTLPDKRRALSLRLTEKRAEKISGGDLEIKTGAPECDEYWGKYEICVRGKMLDTMKNRKLFETTFNELRQSWRQSVSSLNSPAQRASFCRQAIEVERRNADTNKDCDW